MDELLNSISFWIFFLLCVGIKSAGGCKQKTQANYDFIPLLESKFYTFLTLISMLITAIAVIVLSIKGDWWYSLIMIGTFFIISPIVVVITIMPISRILGNIFVNLRANRRLIIDMDSERQGMESSVWMVISIFMEIVFSVWMIVEFFA